MTPNLPPLADDSAEALERHISDRAEKELAEWLTAAPEMTRKPSDALVEQGLRFLSNLRKWRRGS